DRGDVRRQSVQPVDEVHGVDGQDGEQDRYRDGEIAAEVDDLGVPPELRQQGELNAALGDHDAGGHDLAGQLGQRVEFVAIVEDTDQTDDGAGNEQPVE